MSLARAESGDVTLDDRADPADRAIRRRHSRVATQQKLGLWPQQRAGHYPRHRFGTFAARPHLKRPGMRSAACCMKPHPLAAILFAFAIAGPGGAAAQLTDTDKAF